MCVCVCVCVGCVFAISDKHFPAYCIASNYGHSCIKTWSCLVTVENRIITKLNARP